MDNPKALQTFIDLEVARCNERWIDIPELARRYKKYHPYESVLEFTARMEAEFILLVRQIRQEIVATDSNVTDLPSSASSPASPTSTSPPTTPAPTTRKWGNRQIMNTIGSSSNLSNSSTAVGTTSIVKRNYPEESDVFYQLDDPSSISLAPRLLPSQVQLILVRLLDVIQRQIKSGELETPDDWQAQFSKIILARIYYETGRYDKALEWLQHLALRLEDVEAGYGLVLLVQARVIKGVCFEKQENYTEALDCYLGALKVAEQHPNEQNKSLSFWLEECLYRSVLLQLRKKGPVKQTLKLMRTYLHYCCTQWPSDWRIHKRWIVFRHYIRYLTRAYQKGVYVPAAPEDEYTSPASPVLSPSRSVFSETGDTTLFERSAAALDETIQLMTQFRSLLTVFANAYHKKNPVDLSHRALELSNLMFAAHDTVGWGSTEYTRRTLRYLYRTRKFTFNSLCTTRHIFYTLLKLGDVQEAKLALLEYLELLNVPHVLDKDQSALTLAEQQQSMDSSDDEDEDAYLENIAETIQNRLDHIVHQSMTSTNKNLLFWEDKLKLLQGTEEGDEEEDEFYSSDDSNPPPAPQRMPQKKAPIGSYESDMEFDVVKIIIAASHQLYGQHDKQGQEASTLSDIAVALMEESEHLKKKKASQWRLLMVQSRRVRGASYGLYAMQCHDERKRSIYMAESVASLKRASELDSRSWQTFYELGLQQALMGDMVSAASSAKRSIKLRGDFIPSWHLLSLVQSSRQFHALPKSLQLIQAALGYHMNMIENFDNEEDPDLILTLDTEEGQEFYDRAEAYIKIRMSQLCFLEILEGAEAAIKAYPDLFDMYAKLSQKMSLAVSVADMAEKPTHSRKPSASSHSQRQDGSNSVRSRANSRTNISSVHSFNSLFDNNEDKESLNSSNFALPSPQQPLHDDEVSLDDDMTSNKLHEDSDFMRSSTLLKVEEEEDPAEPYMEDEVIVEEKKSGRKHRKSINLSRQFMDDPLLSFPVANKPKKDKKEKREPKPPKKLLSTKSLFRSSSPMASSKAISLDSTAPTGNGKDVEGDVNKPSEATFSSFTSNSSVKGTSVKPSLSNQNSSSYFSTVQQQIASSQQESSIQLPVKASPVTKNAYFTRREKQWQWILIKIWTMASATYTRAQRFDEAFKAIAEADQLTHGLDADVWHQIGTIAATASTSSKNSAQQQDRALDAFKRALSIDPHHVATHTALASMYVGLEQFELAEQLLEKTTKGLGWNQTEAWYLLSKVYRHQENLLDAKDSLLYALKLSDTNPIESLDVLPRFV